MIPNYSSNTAPTASSMGIWTISSVPVTNNTYPSFTIYSNVEAVAQADFVRVFNREKSQYEAWGRSLELSRAQDPPPRPIRPKARELPVPWTQAIRAFRGQA